jgi:hypothetical protein
MLRAPVEKKMKLRREWISNDIARSGMNASFRHHRLTKIDYVEWQLKGNKEMTVRRRWIHNNTTIRDARIRSHSEQ